MLSKIGVNKIISLVCVTICCIILLFVGAYAINKSMLMKVSIPVKTNTRIEIKLKTAGQENFEKIFSNLENQEYVANGFSVDVSTGSLTMINGSYFDIANGFQLEVLNYSTDYGICVDIIGNNVGTGSTPDYFILNKYTSGNAPSNIFNVVTTTGNFSINFAKVIPISIGLSHTSIDLDYANNTVYYYDSVYYQPVESTLKAKFETELYYLPKNPNLIVNLGSRNGVLNTDYTYAGGVLTIPASNIIQENTITLTTSATIADSYTATFNKQGGTGGSNNLTYYSEYGNNVNNVTSPTKTGKTFGGYYYDDLMDNYATSGMELWLDGVYNNGIGNTRITGTATDTAPWVDLSGNNRNCGFNSTAPTWNSTNGISLDGSDDGVYIGDNLVNLFKSNYTLEMFFYVNDSTRVILFGNHSVSNNINIELFSVNDTNLRLWYNNGLFDNRDTNSNFCSRTEYVHLTCVCNKTSGYMDIYKNNVKLNSYTTTEISSYNYDFTTAWLGRDGRTTTTCMAGTFYSFRAYNRMLTTAEIAQNYNTDVARFGASGASANANVVQYINASGSPVRSFDFTQNVVLFGRWI